MVAQIVTAGVHGAAVSHGERSELLQYDGFGFGGFVGVALGPVRVEASGYTASLDPDDETGLSESVDVRQGDVRVSYAVAPAIALQIGASRRQMDPEFVLQDVGFIRVGIRSENPLSRIARVWVRGAYLAAPKFNGGGSAGFSFEIGLGTWVGSPNGRFGVRAEYDFQKIGREIGATDQAPIQVMVARLGVQVGI
jgi:hypothetical protein